MIRRLAPTLFLLSILLTGSSVGCKSDAQCTSSDQCANGFACNTEQKVCEAVVPEPDATIPVDAAPACPEDTHLCAPAAPAGWSGPVIGTEIAANEELAACPDPFPTEEKLLFSELASTGECSCSCPGVSGGVLCSNASISAREGTSTFECIQDCLNCFVSVQPTSTCTALNNTELNAAPAMRVALGTVTNTGNCSDPMESNDLAAEFATQARYCSGTPVAATCPEDGTCLPNAGDASFDSLCIFQAGDQECPAEYAEKRLRFASFEDTRSCSECSCSGPSVGSSCGGTVSISPQNVTPSCALKSISSNSCTTKPAGTGITASYTPQASFDCSQSGAELSGTVTEVDATTFCCLAPR